MSREKTSFLQDKPQGQAEAGFKAAFCCGGRAAGVVSRFVQADLPY